MPSSTRPCPRDGAVPERRAWPAGALGVPALDVRAHAGDGRSDETVLTARCVNSPT